ncbi:MAG: hypothetical protein P4L50_29075, partial [Anaerolineaceae bacterium]|nr:hypothetical protein [Anaerolineaceae bacterium]
KPQNPKTPKPLSDRDVACTPCNQAIHSLIPFLYMMSHDLLATMLVMWISEQSYRAAVII